MTKFSGIYWFEALINSALAAEKLLPEHLISSQIDHIRASYSERESFSYYAR